MLPHSPVDQRTLNKAISWFVALQDENCSSRTRQRFENWLQQHDSHALAYAEAEKIWGCLDQVKSDSIPGLDAARHAGPDVWPAARSGLAVFAIASVLAGWWLDYSAPTNIYSTTIGQRHGIDLADGSRVELNAHTKLSVKLSWCRRQLELLEGEALFDVAHESWRPFIVQAAGLRVRDIGTRFDVRLNPEFTQVSVLQGQVALKPEQSWLESGLSAGYSRRMTPSGRLLPEKQIDVDDTQAWLEGRLSFNHTPLKEVASELERYHDVRFVFADPTVAAQTLSGNFETGDLRPFLRALETILPVKAQRQKNTVILRRR